jgi:hypothetical protein
MPSADTYFISWKGRRDGPYTLVELAKLLEQGEIGLLHRVETTAGMVPLRDLLPAIDEPLEPRKGPVQAGLLGPLPTTEPTPRPEAVSRPEIVQPAIDSLDSERAARLYTLCGLCFLIPPLAAWNWTLANQLVGQGHPVTAARMKKLSLGLAAGGILLWVLLWHWW